MSTTTTRSSINMEIKNAEMQKLASELPSSELETQRSGFSTTRSSINAEMRELTSGFSRPQIRYLLNINSTPIGLSQKTRTSHSAVTRSNTRSRRHENRIGVSSVGKYTAFCILIFLTCAKAMDDQKEDGRYNVNYIPKQSVWKDFKEYGNLDKDTQYYSCPHCMGHGECAVYKTLKYTVPQQVNNGDQRAAQPAPGEAEGDRTMQKCKLCKGKGYFEHGKMTPEQEASLAHQPKTKTEKMLAPLLAAVGLGAFGGYQAAGSVRDAMYEVQNTLLDKYTRGDYFFENLADQGKGNEYLTNIVNGPESEWFGDTSIHDRYTTMITGKGSEGEDMSEWGSALQDHINEYIAGSDNDAQVNDVINGHLGSWNGEQVGDELQSISEFTNDQYGEESYRFGKQLESDVIFGGLGIFLFMLIIVYMLFFMTPRQGNLIQVGMGTNFRLVGAVVGTLGAILTGAGIWSMKIEGQINTDYIAQIKSGDYADAGDAITYVSRFNTLMAFGAGLFALAVIMGLLYVFTVNKENHGFQLNAHLAHLKTACWAVTAGCTIGAATLANDLIKQQEHLGDAFNDASQMEILSFAVCCGVGLLWAYFSMFQKLVAPGGGFKLFGKIAGTIVLAGAATSMLTVNFLLEGETQIGLVIGGLLLAAAPIAITFLTKCVQSRLAHAQRGGADIPDEAARV